jgi:lysozyme
LSQQPQRQPNGRAVGVGSGLVLASAVALGLLAKWEPAPNDPGLVYADKLANGLPTVCNGITRHVTSTPIVVGDRWPAAKCAAEERKAVLAVQGQILRCFTRTPPQSVFDAATSHAWNLGASRTCGSQAMAAWNAGDWALGCRRIAFSDSGKRVWSSAGGKIVRGLYLRREDEVRVCMRDVA